MNRTIVNDNKRFNAELDAILSKIKPKLIEAFTNIYGAKHREYIRYTIEHLNFGYFISETFVRKLLNEPSLLNEETTPILKRYLNYFDERWTLLEYTPEKDAADFIINGKITKLDIPEDFLRRDQLLESLLEDCPIFGFLLNDNNESLKYILLPIFTLNLEMIIHEINHALTLNIIAYDEEGPIMPSTFVTPESEELMNDLIANEVLKEYIRIGGEIPDALKRFHFENNNEKNDYLVRPLYDTLKPIILESLITQNTNLFHKKVGENNNQYFCHLVSDLYNEGYQEDKYQELQRLVKVMSEKAARNEEADYDAYFSKLESLGYRVRKL